MEHRRESRSMPVGGYGRVSFHGDAAIADRAAHSEHRHAE